MLAVLVVAACSGDVTPSPALTSGATTGSSASAPASATTGPSDTAEVTSPPASQTAEVTPAPPACSGNDNNRAFFAKASTVMTWSVYCAVLPDGWFVEKGTYRMANGGELEIAYNGPGHVHIAMVEGNTCDQYGSNIDACAPRDAVIGQAYLGDRVGQLGQLSNAFVLDVDRGANPSWRVTGLGVSQADFVAICAAMLRVAP